MNTEIRILKTSKTLDNADFLTIDNEDEFDNFIYNNIPAHVLKSRCLNYDWLKAIKSSLLMHSIECPGKTCIFKYQKQFYVDVSCCDYAIISLRDYLKSEYECDHKEFRQKGRHGYKIQKKTIHTDTGDGE